MVDRAKFITGQRRIVRLFIASKALADAFVGDPNFGAPKPPSLKPTLHSTATGSFNECLDVLGGHVPATMPSNEQLRMQVQAQQKPNSDNATHQTTSLLLDYAQLSHCARRRRAEGCYFDLPVIVQKTCDLVIEAGKKGCDLIVFREGWILPTGS